MKTGLPGFIIICNGEEWRSWLEQNHDKQKELWISIFKKKYTHKGISYESAVEEALCFGWIDGMMKPLDEEKFILRFSPRRKKSPWSLINKNRAEKMIREGKMTLAGMNVIEEAKKNGWWENAYSSKDKPVMPEDILSLLKSNEKAWKKFNQLSNSERTQLIFWINAARKQETRNKRIQQIIDKLNNPLLD